MIWIIQMGRPFVERTVWCNIFCCSLTILNWWVLKQLCMKPTCSDQPILYIWPNFEGILCNLDDVVHMNRGLPDEWRSFSPLTSNITSHLWDCSKDCPHLHSLHFVIHQKRKKWFFSVNVNIPKIPLTSEEYNKLIGYWLSQSDSALQDIRSDQLTTFKITSINTFLNIDKKSSSS